MARTDSDDVATIVFDGLCSFCAGAVSFIIRHDPHKRFRFTPVQSALGQELLRKHDLRFEQLQSFLLIDQGRAYQKSTAALRVARRLSGLWPLLTVLTIIPRPIRNAGYAAFSRRKYALFGKRETCWLPPSESADRFLA